MSYILEALKKSEKKRRDSHGSLSDLATREPQKPGQSPRRRPLWPLLLGLALVVNAAIMLLLFWPESEQHSDTHSPPATESSAVAAPSLQPTAPPVPTVADGNTGAPERREPHMTQTEKRPAVEAVSYSTGTANERGTHPKIPAPVASATAAQVPVPVQLRHDSPAPQQPAFTSNAPVVAEAELKQIGELPLSYRQQLPEMHMSVHVYAGSPEAGLIRINQQMLRPGDHFAERLLLEEITRDGAVFSYLGQRFLLPRGH